MAADANMQTSSASVHTLTEDQRHQLPLVVQDLTVAYHRKPVLWDVDLALPEGRLIAVVGPNGAGKSTFIKAVLGLIPRASGRVTIYGQPYERQRGLVGYVPQRESVDWDFPVNALDVVAMGLYGRIGWFRPVGGRHRRRAMEELEKVGMAAYAQRQISQLSGGQSQRVAIARALVLGPRILVCDEAVAALDGSVRKQVLELLRTVQDETGLSIIFISHDLAVVRSISHRVLVMYAGRLVEAAHNEQVFAMPQHPYTRALIDSVPVPDPVVAPNAAPSQ